MRTITHASTDSELVASHRPAGRMDDDGVAAGWTLGIERFLNQQRPPMFAMHQARGFPIALETKLERCTHMPVVTADR